MPRALSRAQVKAFDKRHVCICGGATLYPYPLFSRADYQRRMSGTASCSSLPSPAAGVESKAGEERAEAMLHTRPALLDHPVLAQEHQEVAEGEPSRALGDGGAEAGESGVAHVDERPVVCFCNAHNLL